MVLFGTGVDPTEVKIFSGKYNMNLGVDEIDMNMNLGWLRSGMDDLVLKRAGRDPQGHHRASEGHHRIPHPDRG